MASLYEAESKYRHPLGGDWLQGDDAVIRMMRRQRGSISFAEDLPVVMVLWQHCCRSGTELRVEERYGAVASLRQT